MFGLRLRYQSILLIFCLVVGSYGSAQQANPLPRVFSFAVVNDEPPISSQSNGRSVGIMPDTIRLIFSLIPEYDVEIAAYPWPRAQSLVEIGKLDCLLTYPSEKRQKYALFTQHRVYSEDFGYLLYHKNSDKRLTLESASSFEDLSQTTIITQIGAEWEQDNLPADLKQVEARNLENMLHLLLLRQAGDFFVMMPEQAIYLARKFGYQDQLAYRRVDFIPESNIPFHLGVRGGHPFAGALINKVDQIIQTEAFQQAMIELQDRYR